VEVPEYAVVNLKASPPEGGTVSSNPPGPEYNIGENVTFNAVAKPGYVFKRWEGCLSDTLNTVTKTITGDKYNENTTATAYFTRVYTLRLYATPAVGGNVTASPPDTTFTTATFIHEAGTRVRVVAAMDTGYRFYRWSGASSSTDPIITITMSRDTSLTANFVKIYKLTVNANPEEGGTVTIVPPPNSDTTYDVGQPVNVEATPNPGYKFDSWSGDTTSTSPAIRLSMDRRWNVTANFVKVYKLSVVVNPTGGGTVIISPTPSRDSTYDAGTLVTVLAEHKPGYRFDGWAGDTTSTNTEIRLPMNRGWNLIAKFVREYKLTVIEKTANGGTLVMRENKYDAEARVTVTASEIDNYRFDGWTGALTARNSVIDIIMDGDKELFANYVRLFRLTLINDPTTGGTITPEPAATVYGSGPAYDSGTVVNVTAVPKAGYRFSGWSGASTSIYTTTSITMNDNKQLTANYTRVQYQLGSINVYPNGSGTVDVKVNGVSTANKTIDSGAVVTITATATTSNGNYYRFTGWQGAPSNVGSLNASISFTMTGNVSNMTANFERVYKLTVNVTPTEGGTVTISPTPPNDFTYTSGTSVTVTAVPSSGYRFSKWSGASTSTSTSISITMNPDRTLTAEFVEIVTQSPE
jgi:uncharacterized repeat protein (TIGR02543 family)